MTLWSKTLWSKSFGQIFWLKLSIFILQPSVLPKNGIEFNQKFKWLCKQYYLDSVRFGSWKSFHDKCCDSRYFRQILVNKVWVLNNLDFLHPWRKEPAYCRYYFPCEQFGLIGCANTDAPSYNCLYTYPQPSPRPRSYWKTITEELSDPFAWFQYLDQVTMLMMAASHYNP